MLQNVVLCNIKPCSPGASVSFCRGLVRWWLHVLHDHVCICFLSSCRCNKKAGGTLILWRLHQQYFNHLTCIKQKMTCLQWETGLQGFACSTAWHATIGNNSRKATSLIWRQNCILCPQSSKRLTCLEAPHFNAMVGHGWHTMGQATSPGRSPPGFSRISCSLLA